MKGIFFVIAIGVGLILAVSNDQGFDGTGLWTALNQQCVTGDCPDGQCINGQCIDGECPDGQCPYVDESAQMESYAESMAAPSVEEMEFVQIDPLIHVENENPPVQAVNVPLESHQLDPMVYQDPQPKPRPTVSARGSASIRASGQYGLMKASTSFHNRNGTASQPTRRGLFGRR